MTLPRRWLVAHLSRAGVAAWAIASFVFILSRSGDMSPTDFLLDEPDSLSSVALPPNSAAAPQQARRAIEQRLGLAEPVFYVTRPQQAGIPKWQWHGTHNQYHHWLLNLLHGELGISFRDGQPIGPRLRAALAYTLPLTGLAALGAVAGALALGIALAGGPPPTARTGWRAGLHLVLTGLQGVPLFVVALGLLFTFANPDIINILPAYADLTAANEPLAQHALQFVLPVLTLVLAALPELTLSLAGALDQELGANYAVTARAKGLSTKQIIRNHALPNALLPLVTNFAGLLPTLVAGTVVVESIFALPGTGRLLAEAVAMRDYPVVVAGVLLTALVRLLALALADALSAWADPRIRLAP